ncbi:uncharacterized protein LOC109836830 [Asparagus officinalis]|uniref:uncharacterized protein LOC109836830 n=1 Tax=Asparagus officinalis TaxID=4686 RepID=UPI00098E44DC|nr:uncharacterized protein LOC109836830 [Asparagus officinalis]
MAAAIARRIPSLHLPFRFTVSPSPSSPPPSISSLLPLRSSIPRFQRPIRRGSLVLSSMIPAHSAIASARLVSKLPSESNDCIQGRFANYLSPI